MKDIKKYLIGFIVGLSIVIATSYAANSGSIGALFQNIPGTGWVLDGLNIKPNSIKEISLEPIIKDTIGANTADILINSGAIQNILDNNVVNSKNKNGYILAPGNNANKVWKTDGSGNPAWRVDTNTWRGVVNNLSSTSTTKGLTANQGRVLNNKITSGMTNLTVSKYMAINTFSTTTCNASGTSGQWYCQKANTSTPTRSNHACFVSYNNNYSDVNISNSCGTFAGFAGGEIGVYSIIYSTTSNRGSMGAQCEVTCLEWD